MKQIKLNLGSGVGLLSGFINVDIMPLKEIQEGIKTRKGVYGNGIIQRGAKYEQASITKMPFPDNYADYALMSEVLEHFPIRYVQDAMNEVYRVMKPGSLLVTTTPDFNSTAKWWVDTVGSQVGKFKDFKLYTYLAEILYGSQRYDGDFHHCPMTPDYVNLIHRVAGWTDVRVSLWPRNKRPGKRYPGMLYDVKKSILRADTIVTEAVK